MTTLPSLRLWHEFLASKSCNRRLLTVVGQVSLLRLRSGSTGQQQAEFRAKNIDLVFENARFFGWRLPFPAIAWFPDFQHRRAAASIFAGRPMAS